MGGSNWLAVACPRCAAQAGNRCRIPSGRHERRAHPERQRARFAKDPATLAAVAEYEWAHNSARRLARLLEQEEGAEA